MLEWTADKRWQDAWNESADALLSRRDEEGYWTQRLYGQELRGGLTPPHGLVGNVQALLPLLDGARADTLKREAGALLAGNAVRADGLANWPPRPRPELPGPDGQIRVQWCAGAPGIVIGAATYLDEELVRAGAELAWHTGPPGLEKGPGICHGTAGNGYAFLKAFARTGEEQWLERARRSQCMRSSKSNGCAASMDTAATPCGPATSARRSSRLTASTGRAAIPSSTASSFQRSSRT
jgi:lantibiotic modifying enzyme